MGEPGRPAVVVLSVVEQQYVARRRKLRTLHACQMSPSKAKILSLAPARDRSVICQQITLPAVFLSRHDTGLDTIPEELMDTGVSGIIARDKFADESRASRRHSAQDQTDLRFADRIKRSSGLLPSQVAAAHL